MADRELYRNSLDKEFQSIASKYRAREGVAEMENMMSRSPYRGVKSSEKAIRQELDRASDYQDHRLTREIQNNTYLRKDINDLKSTVSALRTPVRDDYLEKERVKVNQIERESDVARKLSSPYTNEYDAEVLKRRQYEREQELLSKRSGASPIRRTSPKKHFVDSPLREKVRIAQIQREEELMENYYRRQKESEYENNRLKESIASNRTFELSQSLKSTAFKDRNTLKGVEDRLDNMERELDGHLSRNGQAYFTNKELVKAAQLERERLLQRKKELDEELSQATPPKNQFQAAFDKRERKILDEEQELGKVKSDIRTTKVHRPQSSPYPEDYARHNESDFQPSISASAKKAYERELELLHEENMRIKKELEEAQKAAELENKYKAARPLPEPLRRTSKPELPKKRDLGHIESDKAYAEMARDDDIRQTVQRARKKIHEQLENNERTKSVDPKKKIHYMQPKYESLKRKTYKKYFGYPSTAPHLQEATYLLAKGLPTTLCSDTNVETKVKDPKKSLPRKFEKVLYK